VSSPIIAPDARRAQAYRELTEHPGWRLLSQDLENLIQDDHRALEKATGDDVVRLQGAIKRTRLIAVLPETRVGEYRI
jgi:hypothetical protein